MPIPCKVHIFSAGHFLALARFFGSFYSINLGKMTDEFSPDSNAIMRDVASSLSATSAAVKLVAATLLVFYGLSFNSGAVEAVSVTPGYFWPPHFWVWTAFTHCFLEVHFWEVVLDVAVIVLVGKLLEPLWGAVEMLLFFGVVNVGVAVISSFFYYVLYMLTFNTELLFEVHIHGQYQ